MMLDKCFVIMPFSQTNEIHTEDYWTNHFSQFLEPLIKENFSFPIKRSTLLRADIVKDIIRDLIFSKFVVADISDANPNVLWELGVRHSFTNGTVVIAEKKSIRPFDISKNPILEYPSINDPNYDIELIKFKRDFFAAISDWKEKPTKFDSPVLEALSGRGTIFEIIFREEIIRKMDGFIQELGYNKFSIAQCIKTILDNQKTFPRMTAPTHRVSTCSAELLITTRYLNEDSAFYTKIINYYSSMNSINGQIALWPQNPNEVQNWFLKTLRKLKDPVEELEQIFNQKRSDLQERI